MAVGNAAVAALLAIGVPSHPASAIQNDAEVCVKGRGSPADLVQACTRALEGWFSFGRNTDSLLAARAFHYIDLNQPDKALDDLEIVLTAHPKWSRSLNDRCLAYWMKKEFDKSIIGI
jgi:hypothetical protein